MLYSFSLTRYIMYLITVFSCTFLFNMIFIHNTGNNYLYVLNFNDYHVSYIMNVNFILLNKIIDLNASKTGTKNGYLR